MNDVALGSEHALVSFSVVGWRAEKGALVRDYTFDDFAQALGFVTRVGALAESAGHHPDILLHDYNQVTLRLFTHSEGKVTIKDKDLAVGINGLL